MRLNMEFNIRAALKWLGVIGGCLAMVACMSMKPMGSDSESLKRNLRAGDKVEIHKIKGEPMEFTVTSVDEKGVHGAGVDVAFADIQTISRKENSWWRTGLAALGAVVAVVLVSSGGGTGGGW